jgi:hypothetical protein
VVGGRQAVERVERGGGQESWEVEVEPEHEHEQRESGRIAWTWKGRRCEEEKECESAKGFMYVCVVKS